MQKHRFYLQKNIQGDSIIIEDKGIIRQITKVLRLRPENSFFVFDSTGKEVEVGKWGIGNGVLNGKVVKEINNDTDSSKNVRLYISLLKQDKLEWVVQKATELGVREIIPVYSTNCVVKSISDKKLGRLRKISQESTEQCGGSRLTLVKEGITFIEAMKTLEQKNIKSILAHEKESKKLNFEALSDVDEINIFIGPEGGFTDDEVMLARDSGVEIISLSDRILRAETAALYTLSNIL